MRGAVLLLWLAALLHGPALVVASGKKGKAIAGKTPGKTGKAKSSAKPSTEVATVLRRTPCTKEEIKRKLGDDDCVAAIYPSSKGWDDKHGVCTVLGKGRHNVSSFHKERILSLEVQGTCVVTVTTKEDHSKSTSAFFAGKHDVGHHPVLRVVDGNDFILISDVFAGERGAEFDTATSLICSAVLLPTVYLLCAYKKTALWSWPILDKVLGGLLSLLWFSIYKNFWDPSVWNGKKPYGWAELLLRFVGVLLATCVLFQKLENVDDKEKGRDMLHHSTTLINPLLNAFANGIAMSFLFSLEHKTLQEATVSCLCLYAGQIVFIAVMHFVMTHIGGSNRDNANTEAHMPGEHDQDEAMHTGEWQTAAESVLWDSLGASVATSLSVLAHMACVGGFYKLDDVHSWKGGEDGDFWAIGLVLLTLIGPIQKSMLAGVSSKGITGKLKLLLSTVVGKASAFCLLQVIRHVMLSVIFPGLTPIFADLVVAFTASFLVSTMGGMLVFLKTTHLDPSVRHFIRANLLTEAANTAGATWGKVYGKTFESGVVQSHTERFGVVIILSAVCGSVWLHYVKPQVKLVMKQHQDDEKRKGKTA